MCPQQCVLVCQGLKEIFGHFRPHVRSSILAGEALVRGKGYVEKKNVFIVFQVPEQQ